MRSRYLVVCLAVLALAVNAAPAQVIFIDPCGIQIPAGTSGTMYATICLERAIEGGITSAEFRIAGLPPTWVATVTAEPPATLTGDPFGNGVIVTFPSCQGPTWGTYLRLFTAQVFATDARDDVVLMVAKTIPVSDPNTDCSFAVACSNSPKVCVYDHGAIVNPMQHNCALPVAAQTWSGIKRMYE